MQALGIRDGEASGSWDSPPTPGHRCGPDSKPWWGGSYRSQHSSHTYTLTYILCIPTHSHICVHVSTHTLTPTHMHTHAPGLILTALGQSWGGMSCVAPVLPLMAPLLSSNAGLTLTQDLPQATDWHQSPGSAHQPKDIATSVFPLFTGLRPHAKGQGKWADWGSHLSRRWGCSPPGE